MRHHLHFFVAGDVRIAEQCAGIAVGIGGFGCIKHRLFELIQKGTGVKGSLSIVSPDAVGKQRNQKLQQIIGEKSIVSSHDKPPHCILPENMLRPVLQLLGEVWLGEKQRVLFQHSGEVIFPAVPGKISIQKILQPVFFIGAEVIVSQLGFLGEPVPGVLRWAVGPAVRQIAGAKFL